MATQTLVPFIDENVGAWTRNPVGAPDTLASALAEKDEVAVIRLNSADFPSTARFKMSEGQTPEPGDRNFSVRISRAGTAEVIFTATLREGGGSIVGGGTQVGTTSMTRNTDGWATMSFSITEPITDYTDLYMEITADIGV